MPQDHVESFRQCVAEGKFDGRKIVNPKGKEGTIGKVTFAPNDQVLVEWHDGFTGEILCAVFEVNKVEHTPYGVNFNIPDANGDLWILHFAD